MFFITNYIPHLFMYLYSDNAALIYWGCVVLEEDPWGTRRLIFYFFSFRILLLATFSLVKTCRAKCPTLVFQGSWPMTNRTQSIKHRYILQFSSRKSVRVLICWTFPFGFRTLMGPVIFVFSICGVNQQGTKPVFNDALFVKWNEEEV